MPQESCEHVPNETVIEYYETAGGIAARFRRRRAIPLRG